MRSARQDGGRDAIMEATLALYESYFTRPPDRTIGSGSISAMPESK